MTPAGPLFVRTSSGSPTRPTALDGTFVSDWDYLVVTADKR
jgi:hypothetical protein